MLKFIRSTRIVTVGGSLLCALGIGYFMQMTDSGPAPAAGQIQVASAGVIQSDALSDPVTPVAEGNPDKEQLNAQEAKPASDQADEADPTQTVAPAQDTLSGDGTQVDPAEQGFAMDEIVLTSAAPIPPVAAPQPATLPAEPVVLTALEDAPIKDLPSEEVAPGFSCDINMMADPTAAALVTLTLEASCLPNERFTVHHNGMMFTAVTDDAGVWSDNVPALSASSMFIAAFPNGEGAVADTTVDTLEYYDRYVVQWKGYSGLQIHALEYGAGYGEDGHVWAGAANDMAHAARGEGGFVTRMGAADVDGALMAEIYTFPTQTALRGGNVEVSLEAEVTAENCGRDIEAQALTKTGDGAFDARDIVLAMPECSANGDFLVLKNLYEDLKIARN